MVKHISVRVAWHNDGWNGHICKKPKENTYCSGQRSYPGDLIAKTRNLDWETQKNIVGCSCAELENIPPCIYGINAFGNEQLKAYSDPPEWFNDGSKRKIWVIPPATVCTWPYEEMYRADVKNPNGSYNYIKRLEFAKKYFSELSEGSLIFYYANLSNPFSEDDAEKYVIVGISRLKELGDYQFYEGTSDENKQKYAGGFVWQMSLTSHYPDEGFRIPYHLYLDKPEKLEKILLVPNNNRNFKYATRHISDDDALDLVENFLEIVNKLIEIGDVSEKWQDRKNWLQSLISELWKNRGAYPGFPKVLTYLGFQDAVEYFKNEALIGMEKEAKENIIAFLEGKTATLDGVKLRGCDITPFQYFLRPRPE